MIKPLSGWKRIGIILSVVWILGAGIYLYNANVNDRLSEAMQICSEQVAADDLLQIYPADKHLTQKQKVDRDLQQLISRQTQREECYRKQIARDPTPRKAALRTSVILTFSSLALGWGFVYLIVFLVNWVKRGFVRPQ
jgi:hypothetical protein